MSEQKRKTTQFLVPDSVMASDKGRYDIYPCFKLDAGQIHIGYEQLASYMLKHKTIVIDGYVGVFWDDLCSGLNSYFKKKGIHVRFHDVASALKESSQIDALIEPFLGGNDPIFGTRTSLDILDFFNKQDLEAIVPDPEAQLNIIYGPGAALCQWNAPLVYVDIPKNELQFRMRAKAIANLGAEKPLDNPKEMYKRFYFVDWIVLNKHKQQLANHIDVFVDDQKPQQPMWTKGEAMRTALKEMSQNFFRVRPWFEPGAWGGTWMKDQIPGLSQDVPNYAWSFELITPENGLLLEDDGKILELSFDFLMFQEYENVLGEAAKYFGYEFPIRFDYLDTFDGGNLSIQVHPQQDYFVKEFGENFTQDECYYILDAKEDAKVYLGFKERIEPAKFKNELETSQKRGNVVEIANYVHSMKAEKHDLFLIPNGTIHGSGKNNMVLEISATPYIFTFKLYDWLRVDLDGKPRPINIERGFDNLDFTRTESVIEREFISKPQIINQGKNWKIIHLPTHKEHFYEVYRYEFEDTMEINTNNQCHVLSVVEGTSVMLVTSKGIKQRFNYAETFVVPAACDSYSLINEGELPCKVVKAFVDIGKIQFQRN
ncbi:class I mannose-6-phosphate isomerase [Flagellimonas nanhaiensis]|uniref:ROK family protein n=1 Tax=Flagellimonas nanhaiensis TaxID=2292706 RepID=A0A371JUS8_9FLAO|nr:class I mannose-6-phosphate isomerase [Allomuricauda nanhaiensis]RDY61573.1 hypothetical protein DX873_05285 [Allomuricauda nanhaiensis]